MIKQGIDVLKENNYKDLKNKKIGLITNFSFVDNNMNPMLDDFIKNLDVVKIFTPEHGLYGLPDGKEYSDEIHPIYKIPIISLYGKNKKPSNDMLKDIDVLVYDIQDVGLRFYTYIYTLAYTLEAASENNKKYYVLDRINPLGRKVYGNRIKTDSFVGGYKLPIRYGLTVGELAKYFKKLMNLNIELEIIKNEGYKGQSFESLDLNWNVPSPNLPTFESTIAYSGNCFFEGTNLSEGRGTTKPFTYIGAPWLNLEKVSGLLKNKFSDLKFRTREFIPLFSKHKDKQCHGIEFFPKVEDNFIKISIEIMKYLSEDQNFEYNKRIKDLVGVNDISKIDYNEFKNDAQDFINFCEDILIYEWRLEIL